MEQLLGVGRAQMSMVFALATIMLTTGMNVAPRLYRALPPALLAIACGAVSAAGLLLAAGANRFAEFVAGYGVLFGLGAGVGFIVVQQGVNQAVSRASGLANGYVVSLYPLGAMIGAPLFGWSIGAYGIRATFAALAVAVFIGCAVAAALLRLAGIAMHDASVPFARELPRWPIFLRLATVFFLAAAAGLMVMSQAAGIVQAYGGQTALALGLMNAIARPIFAAAKYVAASVATVASTSVVQDEQPLHGRTLRPGDRVFLMMNAANRDPRAFEDPDRLDLARNGVPHLTFGYGAHLCLGFPLARLEGQVALPAVLARWRHIELAADRLEWIDSMVLRGMKAMPLRAMA